MTRTLTAAVHQEDDWYVARCLELDVASQGQSVGEALANLREAAELYLEQTSWPREGRGYGAGLLHSAEAGGA